MGFNIAIDGPAGAGKSTIAKAAAKKLSFVYVDTGAMYRSIGLYMYRNGIDPKNQEAVARECRKADVSIRYENGVQQVYLNSENVSTEIRQEKIGAMASMVSAVPEVRSHLLELQRGLAAAQDVIMDGRDIGTCILPDADVKIYLTASVDVRAGRRYAELVEKGEKADLETIKKDIEERDYRDMHRETAPLKKAQEAVEIDTSYMTIEEAADAIVRLAEQKRQMEQ